MASTDEGCYQPELRFHRLYQANFRLVQGALVTARAFRSPAPFDSILAALVNHATQLGLAEPRSTPGLPQVRDQANPKRTHI